MAILVGNGVNMNSTKITNLADGVDPGDAVNMDQLSNHNHVVSDITDFAEGAQDSVGTILSNSSNITLTYNDGVPSISADLVNAGTAGTYGSATQVPVFTTDAYGRVTSVTNTTISIPSLGSFVYTGTPGANQVLYWNSGATAVANESAFTYDGSTNRLTVTDGGITINNTVATASSNVLNISAAVTSYGTQTIRFNNYFGNGQLEFVSSNSSNGVISGNNIGLSILAGSQSAVTIGNATNTFTPTQVNITHGGSLTLQRTSGSVNLLNVYGTFAPTSGTATFAGITISPTINQTGGASGISRGLYIAPTLTAYNDFRGLDLACNNGFSFYSSGTGESYHAASFKIGGSSGASARLDVVGSGATSATKGFRVANSSNTEYFSLNNVGQITLNRQSETGVRESLLTARVSDDSTSIFGIGNATGVNGVFSPLFYGYASDASYTPLILRSFISSGIDSGTEPVMIFDAMRSSSTSDPANGTFSTIVTRPLFSFRNFTTTYLQIQVDGKTGIGTATPQRTLHVEGEVRITDLTTDTPTRIVGADADGDLGEISVGSGLTLSAGVLSSTGGYTDEAAQDAVGTILTDTNTIDFTYTDATPTITADVKTQMSITSDASGIKLSGDATSPGNSKYYGTNGSGTKGYYDMPGSQSYAYGTISTKTITNDASGVLIDGWTLSANSSDFALDNTDDSIKYTGSTTKNFLVTVSGTASYTQTVASTGVFDVELRELVGNTVESKVTHTFQNASGTAGQKAQAPFAITAIVSLATNDKLGLYGVDSNASSQSIIHKNIYMTIISLT